MSKREHVRDYITLSDCYDQLNVALFGGELVGCVLTFGDKRQHIGYYKPHGFVARGKRSKFDHLPIIAETREFARVMSKIGPRPARHILHRLRFCRG